MPDFLVAVFLVGTLTFGVSTTGALFLAARLAGRSIASTSRSGVVALMAESFFAAVLRIGEEGFAADVTSAAFGALDLPRLAVVALVSSCAATLPRVRVTRVTGG